MPWEAAFDDSDHMAGLQCRIADDGDFAENPIAEVYGGTEDEIRANGLLMAASRDLLEALQALCDHVEGDMGTTPDNPYLQSARAAIAKATETADRV